jgi:NADH dehydrogenase
MACATRTATRRLDTLRQMCLMRPWPLRASTQSNAAMTGPIHATREGMQSHEIDAALAIPAPASLVPPPAELTLTRGLPHVVILGAGFAGLQAAKALRDEPVNVTVIDRHNYHLFQPLLYQVATAALEPADIAGPIRQIVHAPNIEVLLGDVVAVDPARKCVQLSDREITYDHLIVATGSTHTYFGHDDWAEHAPGLKTLEDAVEIRRRVISAFEAAERCTDALTQREWLTFVVVGAGPTGVELAGALAEISHQARAQDFQHVAPRRARVMLVEGGARVLSAYSEPLSARARHALEKLGVEVRTGRMLTDVRERCVSVGDETIPTRTVLWAAGVAASPVARSLGVELDRVGRVRVTPELSVPGYPEVYVIGDLAAFEQNGKQLPGLAPVAMAQGKHVAHNILRAQRREAQQPFRYWDRGAFAVIGRGAAVGVAFQRFQLSGYFAWLAWLAIHLTFLIGFRNRIAVLFNWAYVYFTKRRHAQILIGRTPSDETTARAHFRPSQDDGIEARAATGRR